MDQIISDEVIQFIKDNHYWIVPLAAICFVFLMSRIIKFKTVQYQKGGGKKSTNIQIGNDVLIHSKKTRKDLLKND